MSMQVKEFIHVQGENDAEYIRLLNEQIERQKKLLNKAMAKLEKIEPKTVSIPETKAIPTERSCVDLDEKVTATYYDVEHEEWTRQTVTIADVLDSVCDDYTILPSAEPKMGEWIGDKCSRCGSERAWYGGQPDYCPDCGAKMRGESSE